MKKIREGQGTVENRPLFFRNEVMTDMGTYFNPNNESYTRAKNSQIYIDKTGLIAYLNKRLSTENNCIALSRARRFGKSHAAGMIDAYYSLGSDSSDLFIGTEISEDGDYRKYLNKYNVIHIDVSSFWDSYKDNIVEKIWHWLISQEFCRSRRLKMNRH